MLTDTPQRFHNQKSITSKWNRRYLFEGCTSNVLCRTHVICSTTNKRWKQILENMLIMKIFYTILIAIVGVCICFVISFSDEDIAEEIRKVTFENLMATQAEDMNAMLATIHSEAPHYAQTKELSTMLFENYDLSYESLLFRYIGQDDEYGIVRWKFSTRKVAGPEFNDNTLDTIHVFRQENGNWKIWSVAILEIKYI